MKVSKVIVNVYVAIMIIDLHLRGSQTNDKIGRFYLPTKSPDKNLHKSPDFVGQDRACSIFDDFVGRLFVYRTTNFVYVAMVIVYNGR